MRTVVHPGLPMQKYAARQVAACLGRLAFEVRHCLRNSDADAVHDLRVSIRRFMQSLRSFESLLPRLEAKGIRKQVKTVLQQAGEVRNYDIALELLAGCGYPEDDGVINGLRRLRLEQQRLLLEQVRRLEQRKFSARWRARLQLENI